MPENQVEENLVWKLISYIFQLISYIFQLHESYEIKFPTKMSFLTVNSFGEKYLHFVLHSTDQDMFVFFFFFTLSSTI